MKEQYVKVVNSCKSISYVINMSYKLRKRLLNREVKKYIDKNIRYLEKAINDNVNILKELKIKMDSENISIEIDDKTKKKLKDSLVCMITRSYIKFLKDSYEKGSETISNIFNDLSSIVAWDINNKFPNRTDGLILPEVMVEWLVNKGYVSISEDKICTLCGQRMINGFDICFWCQYIEGGL